MATSTGTKSKTTKTATPVAPHFDPAALPTTGSTQYRHGGEYKPQITMLSQFAKGNPTNTGHVKALVHLGWIKPGGVNTASKSPAFTIADTANLPTECWAVGAPAANMIAANLQALLEAGAPADTLDALWSAYVGI